MDEKARLAGLFVLWAEPFCWREALFFGSAAFMDLRARLWHVRVGIFDRRVELGMWQVACGAASITSS